MATFADGSPAVMSSTFGKGRMLTIGTFLGNAYEVERDETTARFLRGLLDWAGVERPVEANSQLEVRMLESGDQRIVFAFNHDEALDAAIAVTMPDGDYAVRDLESGDVAQISAGKGVLRLARSMATNGVAVMVVVPKK
jgi:beta-galactosidase